MNFDRFEFVAASRRMDGYGYVLTYLHHAPWIMRRLFRTPPRTVKFAGSATVWHTLPSFRRCGTSMEYWLAGEFERVTSAGLLADNTNEVLQPVRSTVIVARDDAGALTMTVLYRGGRVAVPLEADQLDTLYSQIGKLRED